MIILGIETSCDETAAAVLKKEGDKITILSNVIASSASLQSKYGGIIPEQAAREQIKSIIPVIETAIAQAFPDSPTSHSSSLSLRAEGLPPPIDSIAVTQGPGLIGSLLVGVETAKTLAIIWQKPLIPVNHLLGHFYANWIEDKVPRGKRVTQVPQEEKIKKTRDTRDTFDTLPAFPLIGLLVSGGHTDLVLFKDHGNYQYLGGTRDDAAGECFDKCARLLGLSYPGGPEISRLAKKGNPKTFNLPRPMLNSQDFDFSYSGLKTAVANLVRSEMKSEPVKIFKRSFGSNISILENKLNPKQGQSESRGRTNGTLRPDELSDLCASIEIAIITPLVKKTLKAAQKFNVKTIILGGGVAANQKLKDNLKLDIGYWKLDISVHIPAPHLCTDNAAMIAAAAFFQKPIDSLKIQANPNLSLST